MRRRSFLSTALRATASTLVAPLARALPASPPHTPILDAHVHLFDPTRPGGIPWPKPSDPIYQPALPQRLQAIAQPLGVVGAIAIEASPLPSDNDWLLNLVTRNPFMVGFIGDLVPGSPTFRPDLDRLHRSPLFLGVRYGNLWNHDLAADLANPRLRPAVLADLRALSAAGLTFETANPTPALLAAALDLAQHLPHLRIVLDHLPHLQPPADPTALRAYRSTLRQLAQAPNVFIKFSEILTPTPGQPQASSTPYLPILDPLWELFGPTRVLFGSDWPNSDHVAPYSQTLAVLQDFLTAHHPAAAHAVFFANSRRAYRWRPRLASQGSPA